MYEQQVFGTMAEVMRRICSHRVAGLREAEEQCKQQVRLVTRSFVKMRLFSSIQRNVEVVQKIGLSDRVSALARGSERGIYWPIAMNVYTYVCNIMCVCSVRHASGM